MKSKCVTAKRCQDFITSWLPALPEGDSSGFIPFLCAELRLRPRVRVASK